MLEAFDGVTGGMHAATQKRGRTKAADVEYAPCGECVLNAEQRWPGSSGINAALMRL
jgi:hypothetical protein